MTLVGRQPLIRRRKAERIPLADARGSFKIQSCFAPSVVGCLLASALLGRFCYLAQPFDSDAAMFIYMGKVVSEGGRVGRELIDNKFPTVGLLMSVPWRLFGADWTPYVVLGSLLTAISAAALGRSVGRACGASQGWAAALAVIVFLNFHTAVYAGLMLETIHACFAALAAAAAIEALAGEDPRDAALVGLAAGVAAMAKPSGLAVLAAFCVAAVFQPVSLRRRVRLVAAASTGVMIPAATVAMYLIVSDNWRDMPALGRQIAQYAADTSWNVGDGLKPIIVIALLGWPLLVRGWVFRRHPLASAPSSALPRRTEGGRKSVLIFSLLWLAAEAAGVVGQRRMYAYHFFVLGPPFALMYGLLPRRNSTACLAGSLLPLAILSSAASVAFLQRAIHQPRTLAVSDYLIEHARPGEAVWRDDAPRLWLETGLSAGSRIPLTFLFANSDTAPLQFARAILDDFERIQPTHLVLPRDVNSRLRAQAESTVELQRSPLRRTRYEEAWRRLIDYTQSHYAAEATIGDEVVWRRKGAVQNN